MSSAKINKIVSAIVCDSCVKEIEKDKEYCCHYLVSKKNNGEPIKTWKYDINHFLFSWYHGGKKKNSDSYYIRYDFHPACLDEIIEKFLKDKDIINLSSCKNSQ